MRQLPAVNIERLKNKSNLCNTEIACLLLGWQGGTIHQVSQATGLTVEQILNSLDIENEVTQAINARDIEIAALENKRQWHLNESKNFLNNSSHSMYQHERDAKELERKIRYLKGD